MFSRTTFCIFAMALALARPIDAQQTVDVGSISGRVADESGAAVPGATVQAVHQATQHRRHCAQRHARAIQVSVSSASAPTI